MRTKEIILSDDYDLSVGHNGFAKISIHSNISKGAYKRVEKILSPFLKISSALYDCRTDVYNLYRWLQSDAVRDCHSELSK